MSTISPRDVAAVLYGLPFVYVGVMHFVDPEVFMAIMPAYFGAPKFWVLLTGVTEAGLGLAIMHRSSRNWAASWMIVQLGFLYLANLNMWINGIAFEGMTFSHGWHVARLMAQVGLVVAAAAIGRVGPFARRAVKEETR